MTVRTAQTNPEHVGDDGFPLVGSTWRHHNGVLYVVRMMTNVEPGRQDEYPTTVVYQSLVSGKCYSVPLTTWWQKKMRPE